MMMGDEVQNVAECKKKAAELGFDLTKQFLTLAFAGIAFVVGLSFNTPGAISSLMLWLIIAAFGLSALLGLFFLMHGVSLIGIQHKYDIYASSLRGLAVFQILFMLLGTALLVPIVRNGQKPPQANAVEIKLGSQQSVLYPLDPSRNVTVELDNGKVKITDIKK
jgi:hypothetical protein